MTRYFVLLIVLLAPSIRCHAQNRLFSYYGDAVPHTTSFIDRNDDGELFQQYLSSFSINEKCNKAKLSIGVFNELNTKELDSAYWMYAFITPGFKLYPSFILKCKDGYLAGLYSTYHAYKSIIYNLDVVAYDKTGRIKEKTSFPIFQAGYFATEDSCHIAYQLKGGVLYIENGIVTFDYESSRCCAPEVAKGELYADDTKEVIRERQKYIYKIGDNACLLPQSIVNVNTE